MYAVNDGAASAAGASFERCVFGCRGIGRRFGLGQERGRRLGARNALGCDGKLDRLDLGHGPGRDGRTRAQRFEVLFERHRQPLAVVALELRERVDIGEQRFAPGCEVDDLALEARAFLVTASLGFGLRFGEQLVRFELGFFHHRPRLLLRFGDGFVGRALREQQGAVEDVLGLSTAIGFELRGLQAVAELADPFAARVDGRGRPLEQVVDDLAVVSAERFGDLDVSEFSRGDLHAKRLILGLEDGGYPTRPSRVARRGSSRLRLIGRRASNMRRTQSVSADRERGPGAYEQIAVRRMPRAMMSTKADMSNMPTGGITRRIGARTGSVRSRSRREIVATGVPGRTGNHDSKARASTTTR